MEEIEKKIKNPPHFVRLLFDVWEVFSMLNYILICAGVCTCTYPKNACHRRRQYRRRHDTHIQNPNPLNQILCMRIYI